MPYEAPPYEHIIAYLQNRRLRRNADFMTPKMTQAIWDSLSETERAKARSDAGLTRDLIGLGIIARARDHCSR